MKQLAIKDQYILVDDEDFEWLNDLSGWRVTHRGRVIYTGRYKSQYVTLSIGPLILKADGQHIPSGYNVDHINGDPLDNQKRNLRICTRAQNIQNSNKRIINSKARSHSPFKGVNRTLNNNWVTRVNDQYIGVFQNPVHAALAYDLWAVDIYSEFAKTNFPVLAHS